MPSKVSPTIPNYECSICCGEYPEQIRKKINKLECPECHFTVCFECQRTFSKPNCTNCKMEFTYKFITDVLGKKFITDVVKPNIIAELMVEQREKLRYIQPLVDWEKEYRAQKKNARFGIPITVPQRPKLNLNTNEVFPCPSTDCRGFVEKGKCGMCGVNVCQKCREKQTAEHVCNADILKNLASLSADTKPCPKCCAGINKSEGCDHMFCTHCRTHFSWNTGKILQTSTNGHYNHLASYAKDLTTRDEVDVPHDSNDLGYSVFRDNIDEDDIDTDILDQRLKECLWDDSNAVRLAKRLRFQEDVLISETNDALNEAAIKYMLKDINEQKWEKTVYNQDRKRKLGIHYSNVLDIYLRCVDRLQQKIHSNLSVENQEMVRSEYNNVVQKCNESFNSIYEEFGGDIHHIRSYDESKEPVWV